MHAMPRARVCTVRTEVQIQSLFNYVAWRPSRSHPASAHVRGLASRHAVANERSCAPMHSGRAHGHSHLRLRRLQHARAFSRTYLHLGLSLLHDLDAANLGICH